MSVPFATEPVESVKLLTRLAGFGFRRIVLPFFEKAEVRGASELQSILERLSSVPVTADLCLETTLPAAELKPVVDRFGLSVCYDLGNTTALGHDVPRDIRLLGPRITHVHVKDKRKADGLNVLLGTGDTDFDGAFAALRDIGYRGDYTCETHRGDDPIATARVHARFVRERIA
jgi:sugar phosphate isomerase/epimerase